MCTKRLLLVMVSLVVTLPLSARADGQIEPNAGNWRTWVISSGRDYRVPPPPGPAETQAELRALADLISRNDAQAQEQIAFWNAGAPAYRWIDLLNARALAGTTITTNGRTGVYTYVALAIYDATIAAWESKYAYNRQRPSERDHRLPTALPVPNSPSYPSEHAAAAQAAASVLAYFIPGEAQSFQTMAEQAGWSRVQAGLAMRYRDSKKLGIKGNACLPVAGLYFAREVSRHFTPRSPEVPERPIRARRSSHRSP